MDIIYANMKVKGIQTEEGTHLQNQSKHVTHAFAEKLCTALASGLTTADKQFQLFRKHKGAVHSHKHNKTIWYEFHWNDSL